MDNLSNFSARDRRCMADAILGGRYEQTDDGLLVAPLNLIIGGVFDVEFWRRGELVDREVVRNLVPDEGINFLLDVLLLSSQAKPAGWYCGVFEGNYTPIASVTGATIATAATECTAYDEATRPAFTVVAASAKTSTNAASRATFTFNATKTLYGGFIATEATKGGTSSSSRLLTAVRFASSKAVADDYQALMTYTLTGASA